MGTITTRKRSDGTVAHTAQIRLKRGGKLVHTESKTFERRPMAVRWLAAREAELALPGALDKKQVDDPIFAEVIDRYLATNGKEIGRTKAQVLRTVRGMPVGQMPCSEIESKHWTAMAESISALPQTRDNYVSHVGAVVKIAEPSWGYPLSHEAFRRASVALRSRGLVGKSAKRDRRPTVGEMDKIVAHFVDRQARVPRANPMTALVVFALFSTRRLDEILRIQWVDLDETHSRVLVRDMKNPGEKVGNHVWCDLPAEALRIIRTMPQADTRIFPFGNDAVGMAFTRAMQFLEIENLHFHDLRHEGVSRLFEMGMTIPQASAVSGHRSWASLQRYAHLRQTGDKWAGWTRLDVLAPLPQRPIGQT